LPADRRGAGVGVKHRGEKPGVSPAARVSSRSARSILALARKARAFRSLETLLIRQGGKQVLYGGALAVAAAIQTWSGATGTPVQKLTSTAIR